MTKRIEDKEMNTYIAIDLETTGLSPKLDKILEVGAWKVINGAVVDRLQFFADPGRMIPERITELTGITQDMLGEALTQKEAIHRVVGFCEEYPLLGHNILFDYSFLKQAAVNERLPFEHKGIDTLKISRRFLSDIESRKLECLCAYYKIETEHHHRAIDDAWAAKCLYDCLQEQFGEGNEKYFAPGELVYQAKREGPITPAQKRYLNDLIKYHRIEIDYAVEKLTKNEASRKIDRILSTYGKII